MSDQSHSLPRAKIQKDALSLFFWALPVAAAIMCGWFLLHDFVLAGPSITIYFKDAQGLQVQNSMVKYRGVEIGTVESLELAHHGQDVAVRASLHRSAADVARQGSIFWIVRPELKVGAISGLQTIVSGSYVAVQPGAGGPTNVFNGSTEEPPPPIPGISITLLSDDLGAIEPQSDILYRGLKVGSVLNYRLDDNARYIVVNARIMQEYAPLVRVDSEFWNAGGINAHLGLFSGLNITAESAQTLVAGGLAFATPEKYGAPATNGAVFFINNKEDKTWDDWNPIIPLNTQPESKKTKNEWPQLNAQ